MKISIQLFFVSILMIAGISTYAQKYKTAEDTVKLNKEYGKVTGEIADLTSQLAATQSNLPGYQHKADAAGSDAVNAATASSDQASKATNGSVKEAKKAKRKAKRAYNEAKDAKSAKNTVGVQEDKIEKLTSQLAAKKERLQELDTMRATINSNLTPQAQQ
jgi:chromosome segregation ATPase